MPVKNAVAVAGPTIDWSTFEPYDFQNKDLRSLYLEEHGAKVTQNEDGTYTLSWPGGFTSFLSKENPRNVAELFAVVFIHNMRYNRLGFETSRDRAYTYARRLIAAKKSFQKEEV